MVARIDLNRIAEMRRSMASNSYTPVHAMRDGIVLWDSAPIADLMPLIERPIANLEPPRSVILLSHRRRQHDNMNYATFVPSAEDADVFHEAHGDGNMRMPMFPLMDPADTDDGVVTPGTLTLTPEQWDRAAFTMFAPEYFVWLPEGSFGANALGDRLAVFGDVWHADADGPSIKRNVALYGIPWHDGSMGASTAEGVVEPEEVLRNLGRRSLWNWLCSMAQNLAWCVSHPEQFPIVVERGDAAVTNRAQVKVARKAGIDLADVRVVELRPHEVRTRPSVGGGRREFRFSFPVRGHWRHLRNGESVWVAGYWKATDKPRVEVQTVERF